MANPHILVIPFPAQGHLIPLLDLLRHLSSSLPALTATVITTPNNLHLLSSIISSSSNIQPLVLPLPSHPTLPPSIEHVRHLPSPPGMASLIHALSFLRPQILAWAHSHPHPPTAVLSDFFLGWTHHLAADLSVPRFAFYSSGALVVSVFDALFTYGAAPLPPPLPSFRYDHLPSLFRRYEAAGGTPEWEFTRDSMLANASSYAAVLNTFDALEAKYLDHLRETYGHDRVWAVGPISPSVPGSVRGGQSSVPVEEVTAWLDACPAKSVVYVCFGSQFQLAGPRARALSSALEMSGARFIWCVGNAVGPGEGLEEQTKERGMVIRGWAPQAELLGHVAVGSFLTHCGWNSTLEGIVSEVLLLTWPMEADQFVNARLLVEEMGVAVSACEGGPDVVPEVEGLARVLAESVEEGKWREVKARAAEIGRLAAEAMAEGGSSYENMKKLLKELSGSGSGSGTQCEESEVNQREANGSDFPADSFSDRSQTRQNI